MKIFVEDQFLTKGSAQLPTYNGMRGIGIHSSSHVESCSVGGIKLGVKAFLPLANGGVNITADRIRFRQNAGAPQSTSELDNVADAAPNAGDKLVLQVYEACDDLQLPGPRTPYVTRAACVLPAAQVNARLLMVLPTSGRLRSALFWSASTATVTVNVVGFRMQFGVNKGYYGIPNQTNYATPQLSFIAGGAAGSQNFARAIYVDGESFDYLMVYGFDAASGSIDMLGEVTGERLT